MNELQKIAAEAARDVKPGQYKCKYCNQSFVRENSLAVHNCQPKRRALQKTEKGVMIGFSTWIRFYELTQGSAKLKTYEEFSKNNLYNSFVKFGRHCVNINAINVNQFIDYVLKRKIKIDNWCKDNIYDEYLFTLLRSESSTDALERSVLTMQAWGEEHAADFSEYFRGSGGGDFIKDVANGRISPWAIYCCNSGIEKLEKLNEEQLQLIIRWIDPQYWERKLKNHSADAELSRHILRNAGC